MNANNQINEEIDIALSGGPIPKYTPLPFQNHAELIAAFHPSILNGDIGLYNWQVEEAMFLVQSNFTKEYPLRHILAACNGSGKDAYIIAPFAVFMACCRIRSRTIITSSSFQQLQSQTENYIRNLCQSINDKFGSKIFIIKQMHIACTITGSEIKMFSTDEPGRAEGYHPFPDYPKGELTIIVNEGKTVEDGIYEALERCTFNRWIIVSSPGKTSGRMYNDYRRAVTYPEKYEIGKLYARKVTAYECPHISPARIHSEKATYGENHPWFRSARLAEFTTLDESVMISKEAVQKCIHFPPEHIAFGLRAGLDLAVGGDENAFYVFDGNKFKGKEVFRATEATVTVGVLIEMFTKYGFTTKTCKNIFADHGGIGAVYASVFREKGWDLSWVLNQSRPLVPSGIYGNRGAELWSSLKRLIEECMIILPDDDIKLHSQLCSRYYKQHSTQGKIILEAKRDARAHGHGSPDRADSVVLAFTGVTVDDLRDLVMDAAGKPKKASQVKGLPTVRQVINITDAEQFNKINQQWDNMNKFGDSRADITRPIKRQTLTTSQLLSYLR